VDVHSRWLEVERMSSTTSEKTIETLQMLFARYGVPAQLVSDIIMTRMALCAISSENHKKKGLV